MVVVFPAASGVSIMACNLSSFKFLSWNVRGLGDPLKCDIVKDSLRANLLDLVMLQETKLSNISSFKSSTFLPTDLNTFLSLDASRASRGLLSAWNPNKFKLKSSIARTFSISVQLESELNATLFWVSNFYGPYLEDERPAFFQEIRDLDQLINGPWRLAGDFNSVRFPYERSSLHISTNENLFNDIIRDVAIQELPLLDRTFTWSNMQSLPIHCKLDRVFINALWDDILPDSSLVSLPRTTSDHFPLLVEISTKIPIPKVFRYYNIWKHKAGFKDIVTNCWPSVSVHADAAGNRVSKLKTLRGKTKSWKKSLQPDMAHLNIAKQTLALIDRIEEKRPLSVLEIAF
jgi:hypothetical protein